MILRTKLDNPPPRARQIILFALFGAAIGLIWSLWNFSEWKTHILTMLQSVFLWTISGYVFSTSKRSATIGAWIGGGIGCAIILDGIFHPIIAFDLTFHWHQLLTLPFGAAFGSAVGSIVGAIIGWAARAVRRGSHGR